MSISISIVVPSYQQGRFLRETLESLWVQEYPGLEVIVQDGGSVDDSVEVIREYAGRDWFSYRWESKRDGGQTVAINEGLSKARGEVVGYLNSDDFLLPGALKRVGDFFEQNREVGIVYGRGLHCDEWGEMLGEYPTEDWSVQRLKETCLICQPTCFWRRELHERVGFFDESLNYAMDYEFWLRASGAGVHFAFLDEVLAVSRCHGVAKRFAQKMAMDKECLEVVRRHHGGRAPFKWVTAMARSRAAVFLEWGWPLGDAVFCLVYWLNCLRGWGLVDAENFSWTWKKLVPPLKVARKLAMDPFFELRGVKE